MCVTMAAVCYRAGHYIFAMYFLSSYSFLNVYHTLTHGVALVRIQNAGLNGAARGSLQMQDPKKSPSHKFCTCNFNGFRVLAALLHGTLVVGVSLTAALNRGRQLYSQGRPTRWALAHSSSWCIFLAVRC